MGFFEPSTWRGEKQAVPALPRCGLCGLRSKCISPAMPVTGRGVRKILFVGEAPGEEEDRRGEQLIGKAGQVLRKILRELKVDLDDCWKTNAVCCRPPGNEIKDEYIEACRPTLMKTVRDLKPNVIVLLGISAVKSLVGPEWGSDIGPLGRWVGWEIPSAMYGAWVCPTYHPSYLARTDEDPVLMRMVKNHLREALSLESVVPPLTTRTQLEGSVECVMSGGDARMRLLELAGKEGVLAFDYETTGLKPDLPEQRIVTCSFCLDGADTWACKIDESLHKPLSRVLQNDRLKKVASNLKFEERWTRAKLGHPVANWFWDVMLGAHVMDNRRDITSVKFQAYVLLGVPNYALGMGPFLEAKTANGLNTIDKAPLRELLVYNGLDSLLEYRVMKRQRRAMGLE